MPKKFSEFKQLDEIILPAPLVTPEGEGAEEAEEALPVLFATIHHKSKDRPDGYDDEDIFRMNYHGNSHLPDLQRQMLADRKAAGFDTTEYEHHVH